MKIFFYILLLTSIVTIVWFSIFNWNDSKIIKTDSPLSNSNTEQLDIQDNTYIIELERWGIHNDGTHPYETTKGINDSLKFASEKGYSNVRVPGGTYLIAKYSDNNKEHDRIKMVSDMTLILSEDTIIEKETNDFEEYKTIEFGPNVKNSKIMGGTIRGDKDTHDYSQVQHKWTSGSHEWGMGINIIGADNIVIDGVKIEKFTGDGIFIGGSTFGGSEIGEESFEHGGINDAGELVSEEGKIRINNRSLTNFGNSIYKEYKSFYFWVPSEVITGPTFDVYYYRKDDSFISAQKGLNFYYGKAQIPEGAEYYRAVFTAESLEGAYLQSMVIKNSKNISIRNNEISFNRRQGITAGGEDVLIENNYIHDIGGTGPGAGIDVEPGYFPAININIINNKFMNNTIHVVLAYGKDSVIENNYFGPGASVEIWRDYIGKVDVKHNTFDGADMWNEAASNTINNKVKKGTLKFEGNDMIVKGISGEDSAVVFNAQKPFGITAENIKLRSKNEVGISIWNNPIHLKEVELNSPRSKFVGNVKDGSIFDKLRIIGYTSTTIPNGLYTNCLIDESSEGWGLEFIKEGTFEFNNCTIKTNKEGFKINHSDVDLKVSNSVLSVKQKNRYGIAYIYAQDANNIEFKNNIIDTRNNYDSDFSIVRFYVEEDSTGISRAQFIANEFYSNFSVDGINTVNSRASAQPYLIKDNVFNNTRLTLRSKDIQIENRGMKD